VSKKDCPFWKYPGKPEPCKHKKWCETVMSVEPSFMKSQLGNVAAVAALLAARVEEGYDQMRSLRLSNFFALAGQSFAEGSSGTNIPPWREKLSQEIMTAEAIIIVPGSLTTELAILDCLQTAN
jgi:hypothetical protein